MAQPRPVSNETFPVAKLDVVSELRQLHASPIPHGHIAKTVVHNRGLRVVMMILERGSKLPRHHAKGSLAIHVLEGRVIVSLLDSTFDLGPDQMLAIEPGIAHALVAIEPSALLLTVGGAQT
jgi:quercetin dioxygenase-like cupin family protein